jgi:hypothetical protein
MPMRIHVTFVVFLTAVAMGLGSARNPFGAHFALSIVPILLLINSSQWFVLSLKRGWQVLGFSASLLAAAGLLYLYQFAGSLSFANFITIFFLGMLAQATTMWILAKDRTIRTILLSESLTITFVVLLGLDLSRASVDVPLAASAHFLFWSPLGAMCVSVCSAATKWMKSAQVIVICSIVLVTIGFLDVGLANNIEWMLYSIIPIWIAAMGLGVYWVKEWEREKIPDHLDV